MFVGCVHTIIRCARTLCNEYLRQWNRSEWISLFCQFASVQCIIHQWTKRNLFGVWNWLDLFVYLRMFLYNFCIDCVHHEIKIWFFFLSCKTYTWETFRQCYFSITKNNQVRTLDVIFRCRPSKIKHLIKDADNKDNIDVVISVTVWRIRIIFTFNLILLSGWRIFFSLVQFIVIK